MPPCSHASSDDLGARQEGRAAARPFFVEMPARAPGSLLQRLGAPEASEYYPTLDRRLAGAYGASKKGALAAKPGLSPVREVKTAQIQEARRLEG